MSAKPRALIAEDNMVMRETLRMLLKKEFDVEAVASGEACLEVLAREPKDLVLLDIQMTGIDGYETCRHLRETNRTVPVIFVSAMDTLEERLQAFDSGGNDFIRKPFDAQVLLHKARKVVELYGERARLADEKASLHQMAMGFLKNVGETGVLLNFMRSTLGCVDYLTLAERLVASTGEYGLNCHVLIRCDDGKVAWTPSGPASELEVSILEKSSAMGRIFQFSRRLVVNFDYLTVLVNDLPEDPDICGRIRDNVVILTESAEAIAETIGVHKLAANHAVALDHASAAGSGTVERLRDMYRQQQMDTRLELQNLVDRVEASYSYLALSTAQEESVSQTLHDGAGRILLLFDRAEAFEQEFANILSSLAVAPER